MLNELITPDTPLVHLCSAVVAGRVSVTLFTELALMSINNVMSDGDRSYTYRTSFLLVGCTLFSFFF